MWDYPVIAPADPRLLSFQNLIELYILKSLRHIEKVPIGRVRQAIKAAREGPGSDHPLADYELLMDRKDIIIEEFGDLINISRYGQHELGELLDNTLKKVGVENGEWKYRPTETVEFSPKKQFGKSCIVGTRIPTYLVFVCDSNGESGEEIAYDLDCRPDFVSETIEFERDLRVAYPSAVRRRKIARVLSY